MVSHHDPILNLGLEALNNDAFFDATADAGCTSGTPHVAYVFKYVCVTVHVAFGKVHYRNAHEHTYMYGCSDELGSRSSRH